MKRFVLLALLVGAVCTALSARSEYVFCVDGPGRGQPFALSHPAHGPDLLEFAYEGNGYEGMVFDAVAATGDLLVWSLVVGAPLALPYCLILRRRRRMSALDDSA